MSDPGICSQGDVLRRTDTGQTYHCSPQGMWVPDYKPSAYDTLAVLLIAGVVLVVVGLMARGRRKV